MTSMLNTDFLSIVCVPDVGNGGEQEKVASSEAADSTHESMSAAGMSAGCYSVSGGLAHAVLPQVASGAAGSYVAAALKALQYPLSPFVRAGSGEGGEPAALPREVHTSCV